MEKDKLSTSRLHWKAEYLSFMYLTLPLGGYLKKASFWMPIIDKIHKKLDRWNWKCFNLFQGGRLTLCKAVFSV